MQRLFSKKQRIAVEIVTGRTGQADHVTPYSKGGKTIIENCQIISQKANRMKGSTEFKPREWQQNFLDSWESRQSGLPYMLIAIPGSGKTKASLEAARRWLEAASDRRLIVVVPTDNLRQQWQEEATDFGLDLQTKDFGTNFKSGYMGGVVTYHLVANQPLIFRKLCAVAPTMVIFDEVHHCGDESCFGHGIKEAFELAKEKLLMSGTPWKSDGSPIPFVRYDGDGYALGNYRYDYPDALTDGVVRYLIFNHSKGSIVNESTGVESEVHGEISEVDAAKRLSILLSSDGDYVRQQILDSHAKLLELRSVQHDAAALAICIDQTHASRVAQLIRSLTGCEPSLIVSDESLENDTVKKFRNSNKEWIVSVRKVSEGTDIKRLQVLCYLTNVTSELFFRQAIGRVSRVRNEEDHSGYVYLPADPRLISASTNIENAQVLALREDAEKESREFENQEFLDKPVSVFSTTHNGVDTILVGNERVPIDEYRRIEAYALAVGIPHTKVLQLTRLMSGEVHLHINPTVEQAVGREDQETELRKKCQKLAYRLSKMTGIEPKDIHKKFKPQKEMSLTDLKAKLAWLKSEVASCERN
jgi:superfamily II DNA or RNA helicase